MNSWIKHLIFIGFFVFIIIYLGLSYGSFEYCAEPIHHWYMGLVSFALLHRALLMVAENIVPAGCLWIALMVMIVPVSLIFVFVWNIVGVVYLYAISKSENRDDCMNKSSLVIDWVMVSLIFLVYLSFLILFFVVLKNLQRKKRKQLEVKRRLRKIYTDVLRLDSALTAEEIREVRSNIDLVVNNFSDTVENMPILPEEEKVISLFYIPEVRKTPSSITKLRDSLTPKQGDSVDMGQPGDEPSTSATSKSKLRDSLTEPLLDIMRREHSHKVLEQTQSRIQENADEDAEECIICYSPFEDALKKVVLKCGHKYHDSCIFSWFQKKITCPMCRRNVRKDLLKLLREHVKEMESEIREQDLESIISDPFFGD